MTLASFKSKAKLSAILTFMVIYGIGFFYFGRITYPKSKTQSVKGASTSNTVRDPIEKPQPYADEQRAEIIPQSVKICSNATFGFKISYPKDWFTTQNNEPQKCTFFAPFSFVVPQIVDTDIVPIKIEVAKAEDWQSTIVLYSEPNDFQNINSVQSLEINGKAATKVDSMSTGKNQVSKGFFKESYLIFDSKTPLIISYTQMNQNDNLENFKSILKNMVESIKLF